jgi:hypothetical protein
VKRTWIHDLVVAVEDGARGEVDVEVEGVLEEAVADAASAVRMLNRYGGYLVISCTREKVGEIGQPGKKPTELTRTRQIIFKYDSYMPGSVTETITEEPVVGEAPEPVPVPVGAETSE